MPGTLTFRPIEANLSRNTDLIGKMNPYCSFSVGGTKFSTQVCQKGGQNPHWIDIVSIPITGSEPTAVIEVNDKDKLTKDDNIGTCTIDLQRLIAEGSVNRWFPLFYGTTKAGDILVEATVSNGTGSALGASNSAYTSTAGAYGNQQVVGGAYQTTQSNYQNQRDIPVQQYTQQAVPTQQYTQQTVQTQQVLPTQQYSQQIYETTTYQNQQALPQQNYQYSNQGSLLGQSQTPSYIDQRYDHATLPGQPGGYGQTYTNQQQYIKPSGMNFLGLGAIGGLFGRSDKNKHAKNDLRTQSLQTQSQSQTLAHQYPSVQPSNVSQQQLASQQLASQQLASQQFTTQQYTSQQLAGSQQYANNYSTTTNTTVNTTPAPQLGGYYTTDQNRKFYTEQHEVVNAHAYMKPVQVTEVVPVQKQVEVYEARRVTKDVMYTQAVPVTRTIDISEPYVVLKEIEVMEPRLVDRTIEVIENVPVKRQVEVIEMRSQTRNVETMEPQTFHKQVAVTEQVPVMRSVEVSEPRTYTKAVEFVEPVIITETVTKELQAPVIISERTTQEVGPASVVGVRQNYEVRRDVQLIAGERQLSQGFDAMTLNQGERRYEDEGSWEQRRMEVSQRVFETHSNQGIMSRGRDSFTPKQEGYTTTTVTNNTYTQNRPGDYRNY